VFEDLGFGVVSRVDLVYKESDGGQAYNSAYVHFSKWFDSKTNISFQERVLNSEREARIVYDDPWYWIVLENKSKRHNSGDRKPTINITDCGNKRDNSTMQLVSLDYVQKLEEQNQQLEFENYELRTQIIGFQAHFPFDENEVIRSSLARLNNQETSV